MSLFITKTVKNEDLTPFFSLILIFINSYIHYLTGCCPNEFFFERSLKRFLFINFGEVKEKRFQLLELENRVLESPGTRLGCIKKRFRASEK